MNIRNESEFRVSAKMAASLWSKRQRLLPEIDMIQDGNEQLVDIEQKYRQWIADLTPLAASYPAALRHMMITREPALQVAAHLLIESGQTALHAELVAVMEDEESKRYWDCSEMLRFCSAEALSDVVEQLLKGGSPWVLRAVADPLAKRGKTEYLEQMHAGLLEPDNIPSNYLVQALGYIGNSQSVNILQSALQTVPREQAFNTACLLARSLYMLGSPQGPIFYRDEILNENMHVADMSWWFAMFGGPGDLPFILERIQTTAFPHWRQELLRSLGYLGHLAAVEPLIQFAGSADVDDRFAANDALEELLGVMAEEDPEDEGDAVSEWWRQWWQDEQGQFSAELRYRRGEPFSLQMCLDEMAHPIPEERVRPHVNMIVYTGQHLPFDAFGYLEQQEKDLAAWKTWIDENDDSFPAGAWWRWGQRLAK